MPFRVEARASIDFQKIGVVTAFEESAHLEPGEGEWPADVASEHYGIGTGEPNDFMRYARRQWHCVS